MLQRVITAFVTYLVLIDYGIIPTQQIYTSTAVTQDKKNRNIGRFDRSVFVLMSNNG